MKLFCFGLGYTAKNLVSKLSPTKWQYSGTNRSGNIQIPLKNPDEHLKDVTHILISVPPDKALIDPVFKYHKNDIEKMPSLKWIGYLSATSVYGDRNGDWVDELTPAAPTNARGVLRYKAEQQWLSLEKPVTIFRLGGIYGPDRNQVKTLISNTAKKILKNNQSFSRIHVDDICTALMASMESSSRSQIYNIVDNHPTSAAEVLDYLCDKLKIPRLDGIPFDNADISDALKSFYQDSKRVRNEKAKKELNWHPKFPSYKEGYDDILAKLDKSRL